MSDNIDFSAPATLRLEVTNLNVERVKEYAVPGVSEAIKRIHYGQGIRGAFDSCAGRVRYELMSASEAERAERGETTVDVIDFASSAHLHDVADVTYYEASGASASPPGEAAIAPDQQAPAGLTAEQAAPMFYIVSLKRSTPTSILWWGPDARGYTDDMRHAGRFTEAEIRSNVERYNNGISTRAIPCGPVDERARLTVDRGVIDALARVPS